MCEKCGSKNIIVSEKEVIGPKGEKKIKVTCKDCWHWYYRLI